MCKSFRNTDTSIDIGVTGIHSKSVHGIDVTNILQRSLHESHLRTHAELGEPLTHTGSVGRNAQVRKNYTAYNITLENIEIILQALQVVRYASVALACFRSNQLWTSSRC